MLFKSLVWGLCLLFAVAEAFKIHPYARRYVEQEFPQMSPDLIRRNLSKPSSSYSGYCDIGPGWRRPAGIGIEARSLPRTPKLAKRASERKWIEPSDDSFKDNLVGFFNEMQDPEDPDDATSLAIDPSPVQLENWKIKGFPVSTTGEWIKFDEYGRWNLGGTLAGCTMTIMSRR